MASKLIRLNNGLNIPVIGLGTYKSFAGEVEEAVKYAINIGYRHIDCAWYYKNEAEVGKAINEKIKDGTVKREELFITTKLWNNFHSKQSVVPKLRESLKLLQLNYVDLFLIHWPFGFKETADDLPTTSSDYSDVDYVETWEGMEECVNLGLAKSIGLSNFNEEQIERVLKSCKIKPVVNQIEVNPNNTQKPMLKFCKDRDIVVTAFCPLERIGKSSTPGYPSATILDPKVIDIGKKYNKTAAQVVLRYLVFLGVSVIPKSINQIRIKQNFEILDFDLNEEEIAYLDSRNRDIRVSAMLNYKDHKYYPF